MNCPTDGTVLESHAFHGIQVDECSQCRGIWFEAGELRKAKDATEPDLRWLDFDIWRDDVSLEADWSLRKCPVCGRTMARLSYADTQVTVDYCLEEHGIWLDNGEFQAILDALEEEITTRDVGEYVSASLEEARELFTGGEGFVSEWKDFLTVTRLLQYRLLAENPRLVGILVALQQSNPLK